MNKAIIVTGTPAAGKTTIAKYIAEKTDMKYVDVNEIIEKKNLCEEYDEIRKCKIIDEKRLSKVLEKLTEASEETLIIDSHMSHYISPDHVKCCIVVKCPLKELKKRLEERGYDELKIKENLDAEIFDVCHTDSIEAGHEVIIVDSTDEKSRKKLLDYLKK